MVIKELITNDRLSTTAFIQFFGALLMAGILCFCVWLDRPYVPELFMTFAIFAAGDAATKGFANALNNRGEKNDGLLNFKWGCGGFGQRCDYLLQNPQISTRNRPLSLSKTSNCNRKKQ